MPNSSTVRPSNIPQYAPPPFGCSWEMGDWGAAWVHVAGELDLLTSPQFRQTVGDAQRAAHLVVLDLRELCFSDSGGVHVILDADADARREGNRLLIVRGSAQVDRLLTLTELGKGIVIFDLPTDEPVPALSQVLPGPTRS